MKRGYNFGGTNLTLANGGVSGAFLLEQAKKNQLLVF